MNLQLSVEQLLPVVLGVIIREITPLYRYNSEQLLAWKLAYSTLKGKFPYAFMQQKLKIGIGYKK